MYDLKVVYTYEEGFNVPVALIVRPSCGEFDWSEETLYINLRQPFERMDYVEINDDTVSLSLLHTELVTHTIYPDHVGIYTPFVKERLYDIKSGKFSPSFKITGIEQFIIKMSDLALATHLNLLNLFDIE
ncbi:hypothetical protein NYE70_25935 [Paenibacillus sp. FSL R5-0407]|uniref:hypothetical protein n=1 Tax=Paenibacillus sp. FSL R5-0407 TaxID=2975320 RepID=UPI0030F62854